ncbi:hypothetical protein COCVIDRAFT_34373 [Bipolaris victoriae FI3]|uniref:Calcineurin-like phosphoesterase domain-containing protein n=1 Tax=Bipolaris victoriae (strain FI3) TaxID=930091 RepID=W7EL20_BIPV3|nr:hypothetical protein COCVIDRAFT_34373 [Bipolaris victoriae FI3]
MRKTRIVCVSDTHNQTPKLPCGDVLIHAGDLTNQGSYSELKKAVEWIERQDFEAKIVVAGNHEITLDAPFFNKNKGSWKWPGDQDPTACKKLLVESKSITYLEHTTTTVELTSPNGPGTRFTVFGSPYTPQQANWAFQYRAEEAEDVWNKIPDGVDIVVTHTPPKGHCDGSAEASRDGREGCPALLRRLSKIRPKLSICGHIHQGRGVETVRWRTQPLDQATQSDSGSLVQSVEFWSDPGQTSNKISLVDLTIKSIAGRDLGCDTGLPRQSMSDSMQDGTMRSQADASLAPDVTWRQPPSGDGNLVPTSSLTGIALENNEAWWRGENHSKQLRNAGHACLNDGCRTGRAFGGAETARIETTTVVNAAYLGPRIAGKPTGHHKPIVVDVQVPVWKCPDEE